MSGRSLSRSTRGTVVYRVLLAFVPGRSAAVIARHDRR